MNKSILFLQTIFAFLQTFSRSKKHLPESNISSIYPAFTDLNCYDYRKSTHRYKQNYIYFLNTYRLQSPFPIYLSIIQSNGPQCYPNHPKSSCAIHSKKQSFRFTRFSVIIIVSIIIILFIISDRKRSNPPKKIINEKVDLPLQSIPSNKRRLDKKIEDELLLWLEKEQNDGYQNISESCRLALNTTYSKQSVSKYVRLFKRLPRPCYSHHISINPKNDLFVYQVNMYVLLAKGKSSSYLLSTT